MLAGLASQSLAVGWGATVVAFGVAAGVFVALLLAGTLAISLAGEQALAGVRTSGSMVRRWSGYGLVALAVWFAVLAALPNPPLT